VTAPAFLFVPGAWHDGAAFDAVRLELARLGHRSAAVDLPCDDPAVDASGYARLAAAVARGLDPRGPVVVGHSMGGITIALVPSLTPVRALVYLSALVPVPGEAMIAVQRRERPVARFQGLERDALGRSRWCSEQAAIDVLYHDCTPQLARELAQRLRPQAYTPQEEICPLKALPGTPSHYVRMRGDRIIRPDYSLQFACPRLGVVPLALPGGHSPMVADPAGLARVLVELVA
jgi:pimeloyl-ACP methyl ester carboxylesterase